MHRDEVHVMARPRGFKLELSEEDRNELKRISNSTSEEFRRVQRSKIILMYADDVSNKDISEILGINKMTVKNVIDKCRQVGPIAALDDMARSGKPSVIDDNDKSYIVYLACHKPKELGRPEELWSITALQKHIRKNCEKDGYPNLVNLSRSRLWEILEERELKPHRITYYLEKKDPEFKEKMERLLILYKEIQVSIDRGECPDMPTVSYDEKPGIQILENTAPDLPPVEGHGTVARDYEYRRHGTLSLLAGLNLNDGTVIPLVSKTHKSSDFIQFLKKLDSIYRDYDQIRIVLDNHSAHTSKEVMRYLETVPNRFVFVFTPKHGSWLNLVESFFGKMSKTMLRGIRASSYEEMEERILRYFDEVNKEPVVYRWTYKLDEVEV